MGGINGCRAEAEGAGRSRTRGLTRQGLGAVLLSLCVLTSTGVAHAGGAVAELAAPPSKQAERPTHRLIVKLKATTAATATVGSAGGIEVQSAPASMMAAAISIAQSRLGQSVTAVLAGGGGVVVLSVATPMSLREALAAAQTLAEDPAVEYAEPDYILQRQLVPNDAQYSANQTHYQARTATNVWGINAPLAWDVTTGSTSVRVAVIDTGIVAHADLNANVLPGYDMVSDVATANDGGGRDADAADAGDWITAAEAASGFFVGCRVGGSSWHGSHVAGTIAAATNNAIGVAGINWTAKIIPVRVLGKCGGYTSDIADGIRWAAGLAVPGAPLNANPARIINMSLGGTGACSATTQNAINAATAAGAIVVVAAGNSNANLSGFQPANCANVITVTSITALGARSGFSNFGVGALIAAPGSTIRSTLNSGTTTPVASPAGDLYVDYSGTSMAAPHVAGVVGLMLAANPALTVAQVRAIVAASSAPFVFPSSGIPCYSTTCGAGMLDAANAVALAGSTNVARVAWVTSRARVVEGSTITLQVERLGPTTTAASVNYATTGGTATSGVDFSAASGTLTWAIGESGRKNIVISIATDALVEIDETFTVTLASPTNAALYGTAIAIVVIADSSVCAGGTLAVSYAAPTDVQAQLVSADCQSSPRGTGYYAKRYAVPLIAGDSLSATLIGDAQFLDTYLYVTDPNGVSAFEDDDSGPLDGSSRIWRKAIAVSGTYSIYVTTYSTSATGYFALSVGRDAACNLDMNGDGLVTAGREGLVIVRALSGVGAGSLLTGTGITAAQYSAVRSRINTSCGLTLP